MWSALGAFAGATTQSLSASLILRAHFPDAPFSAIDFLACVGYGGTVLGLVRIASRASAGKRQIGALCIACAVVIGSIIGVYLFLVDALRG